MLEEEIIVIEPGDEEEIVVLEEAIEKVYPQLENLEVNPSAEKQVFNHEESYGYDEVIVNAIAGDTLEITPSKEEQSFSGVYTEVKSKGVTSEVDENITPNNIKSGVEILGVEGTLEAIDYWSTEQYTRAQNNGLNLLNYVKELPRYIDISNYDKYLDLTYLTLLEKADLREWDLSSLTYFRCHSCERLKELNMSGCDLSSVKDVGNLVTGLISLEKLILKDLKLNSSLTSIAYLMSNCNALKYADLSGIELPNLTNINYALRGCAKLEYLDIRDLDLSKITSYSMAFTNIPTNCEIIVKDETSKKKVLASNYNLTNVKTVAEL